MSTYSILVGYDGSAGAEAALGWALDRGAQSGTPVTFVYAFPLAMVAGSVGMSAAVWTDTTVRETAEAMMSAALTRARASHPTVPVSGVVLGGNAAAVLVEQSRRARMLVVGSHGLGGFAGLLLGSTGTAVSAHAHCPVVVVRGGTPAEDAPVVVGFDDSPLARLAVDFAFTEAARQQTGLRLVRALTPPPPRWLPAEAPREQIEAERARLEELAETWREKYPQVPVTVDVVAGPASQALVEASSGARLVAVGSRGRGGFRGLLLGSVSQQVLHHANCPVAVVRELPAQDRTVRSSPTQTT